VGSGLIALGPAAVAAQQPLSAGAVVLRTGFWQHRVELNARVTLAAGLRELGEAGTLDNFRLAAGTGTGDYHGKLPFLDTDVYKWLEAASWELQRAPGAELAGQVDELIELVGSVQQPDGYLNTYNQVVHGGERWVDLAMGHEMYTAGHLIQAGIAHRRATGAQTLYGIAVRVADLLVAEFGAGGRRDGYCGHPEIETALVELYRESNERAYLDLAARLVDGRGRGLLGDRPFGRRYFQDLEPVRETTGIYGHAVRALYLATGLADLSLETGDAGLLKVLRAQWDDLVSGKTYITGGTGARHRDEALGDSFELPADQAYTETCAAIALLQLSWRLLLATGEAEYADMFERVLYNGFLAGLSLDGERFFYVNPLQVRPGSTLGPDGRQPWFSCACCPPNVMRTLASLPHLLATTDASGLVIHQYAAATINAVAGVPVGVEIATGYPYSGTVEVRVTEPGEWTLALRVPGWARGVATVSVDGTDIPVPDGYVRVAREWRGGEVVRLELPLDVRLVVADPRVDAARGCVAVERGPLVYCAEQVDQAADLDLVTVTGSAEAGEPLRIGGVEVPTVRLGAKQNHGASGWPYRSYPGATEPGPEVPVVAVPYFAWANREFGAMRVWLPS